MNENDNLILNTVTTTQDLRAKEEDTKRELRIVERSTTNSSSIFYLKDGQLIQEIALDYIDDMGEKARAVFTRIVQYDKVNV